jgi:hypothetical protein
MNDYEVMDYSDFLFNTTDIDAQLTRIHQLMQLVEEGIA